MCDYSLHNVASRPAKVGDKRISTQFPNAITRGFSDPTEPRMATGQPVALGKICVRRTVLFFLRVDDFFAGLC